MDHLETEFKKNFLERAEKGELSFRQQMALDIYKGMVIKGEKASYLSLAWQAFNATDAFIKYVEQDEQEKKK